MSDHLDEVLASYDGEDQELRLMIEQRAQLLELMGHPGWQAFRDVVYSRMAAVQRRMMLGRYEGGWDAYQRDVGYVDGMTEAVDETVANMERAIAARLPGPDDVSPDDYPDDFPAI